MTQKLACKWRRFRCFGVLQVDSEVEKFNEFVTCVRFPLPDSLQINLAVLLRPMELKARKKTYLERRGEAEFDPADVNGSDSDCLEESAEEVNELTLTV